MLIADSKTRMLNYAALISISAAAEALAPPAGRFRHYGRRPAQADVRQSQIGHDFAAYE